MLRALSRMIWGAPNTAVELPDVKDIPLTPTQAEKLKQDTYQAIAKFEAMELQSAEKKHEAIPQHSKHKRTLPDANAIHQQLNARQKIIAEIKSTKQESLNKVVVSFCNRPLNDMYGFNLHGFATASGKPRAVAPNFRKPSSEDKKASVKRAHRYDTNTSFCRVFYSYDVHYRGVFVYNPGYNDGDRLRPITTEYKEDAGSSYLMENGQSHFIFNDVRAFEKGEVNTQLAYPGIHATHLYEAFQQQQLYKRFVESQLELQGTEGSIFPEVNPYKEGLKVRFVQPYVHTLTDKDAFFTNCNKITGTLLQEAEHLSADAHKRDAKFIVGGSHVSFGCDQRMFLWNSKFHRQVIDLFINRNIAKNDAQVANFFNEAKKDPNQFQHLIDRKNYILRIISSWKPLQRKLALEQVLDEKTPLGFIFHSQRSLLSTSAFPSPPISQPQKGAGFLLEAEKMLKAISKEELKANEDERQSSKIPWYSVGPFFDVAKKAKLAMSQPNKKAEEAPQNTGTAAQSAAAPLTQVQRLK